MESYFPSRMRITKQMHNQDAQQPGYAENRLMLTYIVNNIDAAMIQPWQRLAFGIVFEACIDYKKLKYSIPLETSAHRKASMEHELLEVECFLRSKYCRQLIGSKRDYGFLNTDVIDAIPVINFEQALRYVTGAGD